jgi:2-polyprenyl-3-methyl-5-hydroxy-6-metoxy-1,4-benzoquinol methylase
MACVMQPTLINKLAKNQRTYCPICRAESSEQVINKDFSEPDLSDFLKRFYGNRIDQLELGDIRFQIEYCADCDFLYQSEVLDDPGMILLYDHWVDNRKSLKKKQFGTTKLYRQYAGQIEMVSRLIKRSPDKVRILEFGAGWGYWSQMAKAHGYRVEGFELSKERITHMKTMGLNLINQLPEKEPRYDFIFSNQVFEHIPDPRKSLVKLVSCLKPGGYIYIRVPDGRGVYQHLKNSGWDASLDAVHPLEHINCFTRRSLMKLAAIASLHPVTEPLRINVQRFRTSLVRAMKDRYLTTHVLFQVKSH